MPRTIAYRMFQPKNGVFLGTLGQLPEHTNYRFALAGEIAAPEGFLEDDRIRRLLGQIFERHNQSEVASGRSLSVGDVVLLEDAGVYACESVGWRELTGETGRRFPAEGMPYLPRQVMPDRLWSTTETLAAERRIHAALS